MSLEPASSVSLEARIARLEAIEEIKQVIARYAQGADKRNDPEIMAPLFAENGVWEAEGFGQHVGRGVIAAALSEIGRSQITWTVHFMVLPTVVVGSDLKTATCHWYLWELAKMIGADGLEKDTWFAAQYDSRLVKVGVNWEFQLVRLVPVLNCAVGEPWPGNVPRPVAA